VPFHGMPSTGAGRGEGSESGEEGSGVDLQELGEDRVEQGELSGEVVKIKPFTGPGSPGGSAQDPSRRRRIPAPPEGAPRPGEATGADPDPSRKGAQPPPMPQGGAASPIPMGGSLPACGETSPAWGTKGLGAGQRNPRGGTPESEFPLAAN
jgi:hypothetical protein